MSKHTKRQQEEVKNLASMSEHEIDTSDINEIADWSKALVGRYYKPVKKQVTLRLDADMIDWYKAKGSKYQTRMNDVLRKYMDSH